MELLDVCCVGEELEHGNRPDIEKVCLIEVNVSTTAQIRYIRSTNAFTLFHYSKQHISISLTKPRRQESP